LLRGGAWNNNQDNARCAYRNRNNPNNRNNNIGFRVCVSTLSRPRHEGLELQAGDTLPAEAENGGARSGPARS